MKKQITPTFELKMYEKRLKKFQDEYRKLVADFVSKTPPEDKEKAVHEYYKINMIVLAGFWFQLTPEQQRFNLGVHIWNVIEGIQKLKELCPQAKPEK